MAQTFTRVNKTKKDSEIVDNRRTIMSKDQKNMNKHRKVVYDMVSAQDDDSDDFYDDGYDDYDRS